MPLFTSENAAELARLSHIARKQRKAAAAAAAAEQARLDAVAAESPENARKLRIEKQIDVLLDKLANCKDNRLTVQLVSALDKLWNLLYPRAGVMQHKGKLNRRFAPPAIPVQPVAVAEVVQEVDSIKI